MRLEGTIKSWNDERGFGFIEPVQGGQEIFVHAKAFRVGNGRPQAGQYVSFEIELGPQGKKRAKEVELVRVAGVRRESRDQRDASQRDLPGPRGRAPPTRFHTSMKSLILVVVLGIIGWSAYGRYQERALARMPQRERATETAASRAAIETFLRERGAQLWIGHDIGAHSKQKKAPQFYD